MNHSPNPPKPAPIPWIHSENHPTDIIDENGDFLARCLRSENAEFVVLAVNQHKALVDALKDLVSIVKGNPGHSGAQLARVGEIKAAEKILLEGSR